MADYLWPACFHEFFCRLQGVKRSGDQDRWMAYCPGHHNIRTQALSIAIGAHGGLVIKCMSTVGNCTNEHILESMGLSWGALYPDGGAERQLEQTRRGTFVEAYDYRDERGILRYQEVRWLKPDGDKTFSVRRPNPAFDGRQPASPDNPKWLKGIKGRRVLYRLPELLKALQVKPDRWAFVVEGGKCVNHVTAQPWGLLATTNACGAGKWTYSDYVTPLVGANVCVVADNDAPDPTNGSIKGLDHARQVCLSLYGSAKDLRLLQLPSNKLKGGLDDWLDGKDPATAKKELHQLIQETPPFEPTLESYPVSLRRTLGELSRLRMDKAGLTRPLEWLGRVRQAYLTWERLVTSESPGEAANAAATRLAAALCLGVDSEVFLREGD